MIVIAVALPLCVWIVTIFLGKHEDLSIEDGQIVSAWISFFGSYFGGVIGALAAVITLVATLRNFREETNRNLLLEVRPYLIINKAPVVVVRGDSNNTPEYDFLYKYSVSVNLSLDDAGYKVIKNQMLQSKKDSEVSKLMFQQLDEQFRAYSEGMYFEIKTALKNVGKGPALDIFLECNDAYSKFRLSSREGSTNDLPQDSTASIAIRFYPDEEAYKNMILLSDVDADLCFSDINGNKLKRPLKINFRGYLENDGKQRYTDRELQEMMEVI